MAAVSILSLSQELALLEDDVREDLHILAADPRPLHDRSDWTKGFDAAVLRYALRLGLVEQTTDDNWRLT